MKIKGSVTKQEAELEISKSEIELLGKIVPRAIRELGGIFGDKVALWRHNNAIDNLKIANKKIKESGLPIKEVPMKILYPLLENSSLEEEKDVREKWANLLANAITQSHPVKPNYAEILKELSPLEVRILDQLYNEASKENNYKTRKSLQFSTEAMSKSVNISPKEADLIVDNFHRLNLCRQPAGDGIKVGEFKFSLSTNEIFEFTTLGYDFVEACRWN
ncbi:hypothetical protein A3F64_00800 [Candidatus Saccharibacteria bacterium RIFCSPHIGHO2_12_FULL_42_8]|nr:MAG: hypothetical protein A3F64_00800 [Candidatus Saccharibacteria bacterium RIFCSPHIGHO2_12_FULL_42_8]